MFFPFRCGLRGGYIELVGFSDQVKLRVKTYLSARSCSSTVGQVKAILSRNQWFINSDTVAKIRPH